MRYQIDPELRVPYLIQTSPALEHTLSRILSVALTYTNSRGVHVVRTRDIDAPLPTAFDTRGLAAGPRPFGGLAGDIYQYEGSGTFRQNQVIVSSNARKSPGGSACSGTTFTDAPRATRMGRARFRATPTTCVPNMAEPLMTTDIARSSAGRSPCH